MESKECFKIEKRIIIWKVSVYRLIYIVLGQRKSMDIWEFSQWPIKHS